MFTEHTYYYKLFVSTISKDIYWNNNYLYCQFACFKLVSDLDFHYFALKFVLSVCDSVYVNNIHGKLC